MRKLIFTIALLISIPAYAADNYKLAITNEQTILIDTNTGDSWLWVPEANPQDTAWRQAILNNPTTTLQMKALVLKADPRSVNNSGHWNKIEKPN